MTKKMATFIIILLVAAVIGSFVGKFIQIPLPEGSSFHRLFTAQARAGLNPFTLDLIIADFSFGLIIKLNLMSVICMILAGFFSAGYIFKKKKKQLPAEPAITAPEHDANTENNTTTR